MTVSAQHLLATVWGEEQGWVFRPRKRGPVWDELAPSLWPSYEESIFVDDEGFDQYWCPLVFSEPRRLAEYALPTRFLWADLDGANPAKIKLRPSVLWKTSGGDIPQHGDHPKDSYTYDGCPGCHPEPPHYHALWWLDRRMTARLAASLSRRIAYAEPGADRGGWDVTQVLRVPGTLNHKTSPPSLVQLVYAKRLIYTRAQVEAAYPPVVEAVAVQPSAWPTCHDDVPMALASLPHALRRTLVLPQREIEALDRSLHISILAEKLLREKLSPPLAALVLDASTLVESKYGGRNDRHQRVLAEIAKAQSRVASLVKV